MKNIQIVRLALVSIAFGALTLVTQAGPGLQNWTTLRSESQLKDLKPGSKALYVCNACKTISEITISPEQAAALQTGNGTIECPSCHLKSKVVLKRSRNEPLTHVEFVLVDEKGQESAFIAQSADKK